MTDAIPIEEIRTDGGTQIRAAETFRAKVEEYATAMGEGASFPPLTVFFDGTDYWLADGFHRLGAYNIVMQALELPGLDIDCEVIEGSRRDAIIYACGTNAVHGIPRTNTDKQNAVKTVLTNPLVSLDENGVPWTDRAIGRICKVHHETVAKWRAIYLAKSPDSGERAVTRGGSTYTMDTTNIGAKAEQPKAETQEQAEEGLNAADDAPPATQGATEQAAPPPDQAKLSVEQARSEGGSQTAVVVEFNSKWDFIYDRLKEIDRAIEALPEPHVAALKFPPTLAHSVTVARCLEIQRWWQEFTRLWAARNLENSRQLDLEEELNAASR